MTELTPNTEIITEWVEALESGNYKQTDGYLNLKDDNNVGHAAGMCCLGVLCEIAVKHGVIEPGMEINGVVTYEVEEDDVDADGEPVFMGADQMPPVKVMNWVGLPTNPVVKAEFKVWGTGDYDEPTEIVTRGEELTELNDTRNLTFPEIAAAIRDQYLV